MKAKKIFSALLVAIILFFAITNLIPPNKVTDDNPFMTGEGNLPMISAHRGGGANNPENTPLAFREAATTYKVDIIESDLWLTADGQLVFNHDAYIDRTSNVNGDISAEEAEALCENEENRHYISDMTLDELKQYNFGYYFEDEGGERIYKDVQDVEAAGLQIMTAEELFSEFYESHPDLMFITEVKNKGEEGRLACEKLAQIIEKYPEYKDNIIIGSFHSEVEEELETSYPDLMRGASIMGVAKFILLNLSGLGALDDSSFACLQLPMKYDIGISVRLDFKSIIDRAHARNIAVQYWTINDADDMRHLIELGCDGITTDNPKLLGEILEEYRAK